MTLECHKYEKEASLMFNAEWMIRVWISQITTNSTYNKHMKNIEWVAQASSSARVVV